MWIPLVRLEDPEFSVFKSVLSSILLFCLLLPGLAQEHANCIVNVSGHDVDFLASKNQAALDFKSLWKAGVRVIIFRTSIGSGRGLYINKGFSDSDVCFSRWAPEAVRLGLQVGAYHLLRSGEDAREQARYFLRNLEDLCATYRLEKTPIVLIVDAGYSEATKRFPLVQDVVDFLAEVKLMTGICPGFYPENDKHFLKALKAATPDQVIALRNAWLWFPDYSTMPPRIEKVFWWKDWAMQQYTGGIDGWAGWDGKVSTMERYAARRSPFHDPRFFPVLPGVPLPLERSVFNGSEESLFRFWKKNGWVAARNSKNY